MYPFPSCRRCFEPMAASRSCAITGPRDSHRRRPHRRLDPRAPSRRVGRGMRPLRAGRALHTLSPAGTESGRPGEHRAAPVEEPLYSLCGPPAIHTADVVWGFVRPPTRVPRCNTTEGRRLENERAHRCGRHRSPRSLDLSHGARLRAAVAIARAGFMKDVVAGVALGEPSAGGGGGTFARSHPERLSWLDFLSARS